MDQKPVLYEKLFEVKDVLGREIRTNKSYWDTKPKANYYGNTKAVN